jgi:hypothetical protein
MVVQSHLKEYAMHLILALVLLWTGSVGGNAAESDYHYSTCGGTLIRVYEGHYGFGTGLRWGRLAFPPPTSPNGWLDYPIPNMGETAFVSLDGCTATGLWRPTWRPAAYLVTTYDPALDYWSLPVIRELPKVYLPLVGR